jgi:hypothetical protein
MRRFIWTVLLLVAAIAMAACDEKLSTIAGPTPNLSPTFASVQHEVFETTDAAGRTSCVTCHTATGRAPAGGLNLEHAVAYDQLVNVSSRERPGVMRVVPGNSDASYMVHKIEGRSDIIGRQMPFNGPPYLTGGQIQIMRRWIDVGAPRD